MFIKDVFVRIITLIIEIFSLKKKESQNSFDFLYTPLIISLPLLFSAILEYLCNTH